MSLGNKPAFPSKVNNEVYLGMTYREYLFACVLQGILANPETIRYASNDSNPIKLIILKAESYVDIAINRLDAKETAND